MEPDWDAEVMFYNKNSENTQNVRKLFEQSNQQKFPSGFLTGPLLYKDRSIETPLSQHILKSNYDKMFFMFNIAFDQPSMGAKYVDIFLLSEGLSEDEQQFL